MQHLLFIAINSVQLSGRFVSAYVISHCAICEFLFPFLTQNKIITRKMRANQSNSNCKWLQNKTKKRNRSWNADNNNKLNKLPMTLSHRSNDTTTKILKMYLLSLLHVFVYAIWLSLTDLLSAIGCFNKKSEKKKLFQNFCSHSSLSAPFSQNRIWIRLRRNTSFYTRIDVASPMEKLKSQIYIQT